MVIEQLEMTTKDGLKLQGRIWQPADQVRAVVCLVHGIGEHSIRYMDWGRRLVEQKYAMLAFDLRGHGKSDGPRGHAPSYDALMDDLDMALDQTRRRFSNTLIVLYGHSLGGNLVLNYVLRCKPSLAAVVATGPALRLGFEPPALQVLMGRIINRVYPAFSQASGLDASALSHDAEVVNAYINDPLVHNLVSARLFVSFLEAGQWAIENATEFPLPLLLMHGSEDTLTSLEGSREFAQKVGEKCTLKIWDGLYHEIHNEPEKGDVFNYFYEWMEQQRRKSYDNSLAG